MSLTVHEMNTRGLSYLSLISQLYHEDFDHMLEVLREDSTDSLRLTLIREHLGSHPILGVRYHRSFDPTPLAVWPLYYGLETRCLCEFAPQACQHLKQMVHDFYEKDRGLLWRLQLQVNPKEPLREATYYFDLQWSPRFKGVPRT